MVSPFNAQELEDDELLTAQEDFGEWCESVRVNDPHDDSFIASFNQRFDDETGY